MSIVTIIGARPQFIKAAMVSQALKHVGIHESIIHTGQHYSDNMSDIFFRELHIPQADFNLGVGSMHHGAQTGQMLAGIEEILLSQKPRMVLVYGDTNSTLAGALAAVKLHIPVAHVEAGLRSFNRRMPEEINRVVSDHVSDILFCPTEEAMKNARHDGIDENKLFLVGDVMFDAALYYGCLAEQQSKILTQLSLQSKEYALATVHRAENTDDPEILMNLFTALMSSAKQMPIVLPLHPRTRAALKAINLYEDVEQQLELIEPVGFLDMICLEKNASLIVTDSGGVQKEAFFHQVPCVTMRNQTEWVELVESDWNVLVPTAEIKNLPQVIASRIGHHGKKVNLYGQGQASQRIAEVILSTV
jgi:UDP-GlcNAc3NAcA epimerase